MKNIFAIIQRALAMLAAPARWIFRAGEWVLEKSLHTIGGALETVGDLIGSGGGGGSAAAPEPQQAAAAEEQAQQQQAKQRAEARSLVRAVRAVAAALAEDRQPDDADIERLGKGTFGYLRALDKSELQALAKASPGEIYGLLSVGTPVQGVRSQLRVLAEREEAAVAAQKQTQPGTLAARIAAKRAATASVKPAEDPALQRALALCTP